MTLHYWTIAESATGSKNNLWGTYDDDDVARLIAAHRAVSSAANWYADQDRLLWSLITSHDVDAIRAWATEMRDEMPDDDAYPQEFCDEIADEMNSLANLLAETNPK